MSLHIFYIAILFIIEVWTDSCRTPKREAGNCIPLYECPALLNAFANLPQGADKYLRQYICQENEIKVCCGSSENFTVPVAQHVPADIADISTAIYGNRALFQCVDKYVGNKTLPQIRVKNSFGVELTRCTGVAVNSKYLLTSAGCVVPNSKTKFTVVGVRLATKAQYVFKYIEIEETTPHPFYDSATGINDLAVLRLRETLPSGLVNLHCVPGIVLYNDGDEIFTTHNDDSVYTRIRTFEKCRDIFSTKNVNVTVTELDLCEKGFDNETAPICNRCEGLPLVDKYRDQYLLGIASAKTVCGPGYPNLYTNLALYGDWIIENMRPWFDDNEPCTTPNGQEGQCRPLFYCPSLMQMFTEASKSAEAQLSKFICKQNEYGADISVCCALLQNGTAFEHKLEVQTPSVPPEFLESRRCGLQHRDDYFSDDKVAIDEYPWIALIYRDGDAFQCSGALINARYVLTTAACLLQSDRDLIVRFGDYSQSNETDCVLDKKIGYEDCTETEKFGVEEIVRHPFYNWEFGFNDISLIRLNTTVSYSDYIRPICLPAQGTQPATASDTLYLSSWSYHTYNVSVLDIKTKVHTKLITNNKCQLMFRRQEFIHLNHMCTLVDKAEYSTYAKTTFLGGVLMFPNNYQWHIEGLSISMYIYNDLPVRYLNVTKYVNWILENMRPWE